MKVIFLTASTSRNAGGLFFTITEYTKALSCTDVDVHVIGIEDNFTDSDRIHYGTVPLLYYQVTALPILNKLGYSSNILSIIEDTKPDIIHLQGLWMYHSWAALKYAKKHPEVKIIIEPHGMLDEWAVKNSAWKKKIVGLLFEYENLKSAHCIHALCEQELKSIRNFGLKNPIAIIPNGINVKEPYRPRQPKQKRNLLYIGRIHPKKGLAELIAALGDIKLSQPKFFDNWNIQIAGWDQNGFEEELKQLVSSLGVNNCITFVGPAFGEKKHNLLLDADAFILPSFSEGLPMTILEAWSYSLPVIMTDFCNLSVGFDCKAAFRTTPDRLSISTTLIRLNSMSDKELSQVGRNGYDLVTSEYQWKVIADSTVKLYQWILGEAPKPDFVYE